MFCFILFMMIFGFGNAFFILAVTEHPESSNDKITGPNIFTAFIFAYRAALGDFPTDKLEEI